MHRDLIGRSFFLYTRVRTLVVITIVVATLFARFVLRMEGLDTRSLLALAGGIALYNAVAYGLLRRYRDPDEAPQAFPGLLAIAYGAVILDLLALTAAVWLVGGGRSPFSAFYLQLVLVSCILLPRRAALWLSALAYCVLVALVLIEWGGLATPAMPAGAVASTAPLTGQFALTLVVVYGMLFSLSVFVVLAVTGALRRVERRMVLANAELSRLSQQRKDFLNVAAHNLQAPIGAVSMMLENMRDGVAGDVTPKQKEWLDRSLRRLGDLTEFMNDIHVLSFVETDIIAAGFAPIAVPEVVERLVEEYRDIAESHGHTLTLEVPGPVPRVVGHVRLLREAVVNYLTNAVKYTPEGGTIVVRVLDRAPRVRIEVQDNGIGIAREDQERLFRDFVRLGGRGQAGEKIKGNGMGLSITKRIVEAHGGHTGVESEPGKGSTFFAEFPAFRE